MKTKYIAALLLALGLSFTACKRETVYTYEVNDVRVEQEGATKPNVKTDLEFISIAYTDLFGSTINQSELDKLAEAYLSFGDKRLMIDMIILNWLNEPGVNIPSEQDMRDDIEGFVEATYRKFFVREPTSFEKWRISDQIRTDDTITPELIYYSFMTSNEYRYY